MIKLKSIPFKSFLKKSLLLISGLSLFTFFVFANRQNHLETFVEALHTIKNHYVRPIGIDKLIQGAIKGMILELDPYSQLLDPQDIKGLSHTVKGESFGLGLEIEKTSSAFIIMSVLENSPAQKAGLRPGDQIIKIDNQITKNMPLTGFKKLFKRKKDYQLIVLREKTVLEFQLHPRRLKVKSTQLKKLEADIFYLKVYRFSFNTSFEIRKALKNKQPKGLILDLRNNPGGVLDSAIQATDLFLSEGLIVSYQIKDQPEKKFYAKQSQYLGDFPMVILMNEFSASGSEVLAGALQYHKRAIIMGQKSFGKGLMQNVFPLKNQQALSLTVAEYKTPSGKSINQTGITPDKKLKKSEQNGGEDSSSDSEVLAALKSLKPLSL